MLAQFNKKTTLSGNRTVRPKPKHFRVVKPRDLTMSYYERLLQEEEAMTKLHPNSIVAVNADTFEVIATGRNAAALAKKIDKAGGQSVVLFDRSSQNQITLLGHR